MATILITVLLGFLASVVSTFFVRWFARRYQFVDRPDGRRKVQKDAVALGGGAAILLATVLALIVGFFLTQNAPSIENQEFLVSRNSLNGTFVGTVKASDPNQDDTLKFEVVSDKTGKAFSLDDSTGELRVRDTEALDFKNLEPLSLTVRVRDSSFLRQTDTATIRINRVGFKERPFTKRHVQRRSEIPGLLVAAVLLCIVGLIDDRFGIRGAYKLFAQMIASAIILGTGLMFRDVGIFGISFILGPFAFVFSLLWLLGAINSLNLIDGIDGLSTSVGFIISVSFGIMALMTGNSVDALIAFALASVLLGFLLFNFPPATIYLGDAGSMLIGLILGTIALRCSVKTAATLVFLAPLTVPLFDSFAAIMRRKLTGRSIYSTDRGHLHHRLLTHGLSGRQALALISTLCLITSVGALASIYFASEILGVLGIVVVLVVLFATRAFGQVEMKLLNNHLRRVGQSVFPFLISDDSDADQASVQLQGSLEWEKMWQALVESTDRFNLSKIRLNVSLPHLHEDFYATWKRRDNDPKGQLWRAEFPLVVKGMNVGLIEVVGVHKSNAASDEIRQFMEFVEPIEHHIQELLDPISNSNDVENSKEEALPSS